MDSTRHVVFLAIVLLLMCGLSFAQTAKNISCYTCSDFNPGNGIPPCNGVPDSSYPKVLCPYGFCYYSEYNFYFNDTILSIPENTSFINRGCYEPNTTFPEDWPSLGINQTRDCLVSDFYVLSFNKDAVHEYDCTCNTDHCNGNGAPGIPSVPPPSTLPLACYSCSDFKTGGGIPNCTGVSATNYPKVICPSGYCYYGENTLYFNDTYIQQPENTRFIIRGCYDDSDGTFPDGWFNLGINKTWDCLVTDYNVLSFNKDADHAYDCTCNGPLCNQVQTVPTFPPPPATTATKAGSTTVLNLMVGMLSFVFILLF